MLSEKRRLQSVWDTMEAGNYKGAVKQMNTYLKKHPNSKLGKAWKAIALERNGDREEAYQLIQEVQQEYPLEDLLLHYIKVALKKMGQVHDITLLQEKLFEKEPNNQHLGEEVFFAYVREHDLKNQQLVALRLFKHFKKEKHYYWSIASNYIQAELALRKLQDNPPTDEKEKETILNDNKRLLSLCEMMIRKKFSESPPKKLPVFLFLVNVLLAQNKHEAALKEICNEAVAPLFLPHDHLQWQLKLLTRLERWEECSQLYKQLLTVKEPDDWGYYTGYMNAMFELRKGQEGSITDDALPFFHEFQEKYSHCRGPFLAEIELEHRLIAAGIIPSRDNLKALLVNYFRRFGHKYCCYQDMRSYLAYLSPEERSSFCETLHQAIPVLSEEEDLAKKENRYHSLSSYEQVCRRLDQHRSIITSASREEGEALANRLWSLYMESTQIGSKKEETENGHGDDLALLSAYVLVDIYRHRNEQKYLLAAIVLLEYLLTQSKHNFQAKLLLINLYSRIGTMHRAKDLFHSMHIKHIQLDSLTHLILHPLINGGFSEEALEICRKIRRFHAARTEEIPDLLAGPYRSQNYQKITEFLSFESRLERSQQLAITVTEEVLLHVQSNPSLDKAVQYFSSDWYLRFPPKFHRSNGAEPTASSAYYFYARRMLDLSPNQDRNILLMVQSIEEEGEHEKQDTKKKEEEQEEKKNFYVLDGRSGATSADVDSRNFTKQVHWLKARSVVAKLLSVHFTELIPSSPTESQSGASSQKATSSASSGSKQKRGAAASTKSQQKGEANNNSKEEQQEKQEKESVSVEQLMAELKASLLVVLSDETLDATKIKDAMAETSKACTEASTVSPDITLFDHWGWTYIFYLFTASQSIHNLAKSFQQEGGGDSKAAEEAQTKLTTAISLLTGLSNNVQGAITKGPNRSGGSEEENSFDSQTALPLLHFYLFQVLTWSIQLLQTWLVALPSKKRKGNVGKLLQPLRAMLKEFNGTIVGSLALIRVVLDHVAERGSGGVSGDIARRLPSAITTAGIEFLANTSNNPSIQKVTEEVVRHISESYLTASKRLQSATKDLNHLLQSSVLPQL